MKINIWTLACLLMGLTACTDSSDELVQKGNEITLKLINHEMSRSEGVPNLNENLIKNADIFFFAYDATTQGPKGNCLHHHQENNLGVQTEHEFSISANNFTDDTSYYIYAIANLEIATGYEGTIGDLKALTATPISVTTGVKGNNGIQGHFVMDGFNDTFEYTKGMTGTTTIPLTRSAAKITLTVNVDKVVSGGATYEPSKGSMTAQLFKGEANGVVNGFTTSTATLVTGAYSLDQTTEDNKQTHSVPFYSYPIDWGTDEEKACFLELMIPWTSPNGTLNYYYYHIPIEKDVNGNSITSLERNHHYIINVDVTILGSLKENETTVTLNPKFLVKDWNTVALDADLKNYRYLWVQEPANGEYWVMNNTEILEIPYTTSHACDRIIVSCTQPNLYDGSNEDHKNDFTTTDPGTDPNTKHFYCGFVDGKIVYKHGLDNLYTNSTFDFTPYDITITIQHADDENFSETIVIKQYPAIYAEADPNSDYSNDDDTNGNLGYMFVNGYNDETDMTTQDYFCDAPGLADNIDFENPTYNMFVITVTSVHNTNYVIGDPREKSVNQDFIGEKHEINNKEQSIWVYAPSTTSTTLRTLTNYLATEVNSSLYNEENKTVYTNDEAAEAGERTIKMLAPKFRVASAYAVLSPTGEAQYLHYMKKRCASYQEDGYPAGRWRLPTRAEFQFINYLSYIGKIPTLYKKTTNYWCAHGYGKPNNGDVSMTYATKSNGHSVRCVYDDWYWGSERVLTGDAKETFTWGDEPITR